MRPIPLAISLLLFAAVATARADAPARPAHVAEMDWLDNGVIRVGVDYNLGGAITWLSRSPKAGEAVNVINDWDWGRQVQLSYYSGPVPFIVGDKHPRPNWAGLGWNPIQAGDDFGHGSRTLSHTNDGKTLYVKCVPMQWPLDDVPGECTFECWLTLDGSALEARCRINNARSDRKQYPARTQELPAVYTNGPYYKLMTYSGDAPFTGAALTQIKHRLGDHGAAWGHWLATEHWAALVNDDNWGLGVYNGDCYEFSGGFAGVPGAGGAHDAPTGYIAPNRLEILDHDISSEFNYALVLGSLDDIRAWATRAAPRPAPPRWQFDHDRQGWSYVNASDAGWPIRGELNVAMDREDPQLIGPTRCWRAQDAPVLHIEAALHADGGKAEVFYRVWGDTKFDPNHRVAFDLNPDGQYHVYQVDLSHAPGYQGAITQLRLDPIPTGRPGDWFRVKSIEVGGPAR